MEISSVWGVFSISRASESDAMCIVHLLLLSSSRFGHGFTLHISIQPTGAPNAVLERSGSILERSTGVRRSFRSSGPRSPTTGEPPTSPRRTVAPSLYDTDPVQQFIMSTFPGSLLLEQHQVQ